MPIANQVGRHRRSRCLCTTDDDIWYRVRFYARNFSLDRFYGLFNNALLPNNYSCILRSSWFRNASVFFLPQRLLQSSDQQPLAVLNWVLAYHQLLHRKNCRRLSFICCLQKKLQIDTRPYWLVPPCRKAWYGLCARERCKLSQTRHRWRT